MDTLPGPDDRRRRGSDVRLHATGAGRGAKQQHDAAARLWRNMGLSVLLVFVVLVAVNLFLDCGCPTSWT